MNTESKERLALTGQNSKEAMSARLLAARTMASISQETLGHAIGVTKAAVNNMEKGRSFVSLDAMSYFHKEHRLDFNFFIAGLYAQLPADVQQQVFGALEAKEQAQQSG